jgi:hypothetical protein
LIPRVVEEATATPGVTHENPMGGFSDSTNQKLSETAAHNLYVRNVRILSGHTSSRIVVFPWLCDPKHQRTGSPSRDKVV